jgi:hypothetical protein
MLIHTRSPAATFFAGLDDDVVDPSFAIPSQGLHPSILNTIEFMSAPLASSCGDNEPGGKAARDITIEDSDMRFASADAAPTSAVFRTKVLRPIIM